MVEMPGPNPSSGKSMGAQPEELPAIPPPIAEPAAEPAAAGGGGWFGGWFSGGKKEEEQAPAPPTDLSEDRCAPPPMPNFGGGAPEPQFR
mgnify:CR=1 FL=1